MRRVLLGLFNFLFFSFVFFGAGSNESIAKLTNEKGKSNVISNEVHRAMIEDHKYDEIEREMTIHSNNCRDKHDHAEMFSKRQVDENHPAFPQFIAAYKACLSACSNAEVGLRRVANEWYKAGSNPEKQINRDADSMMELKKKCESYLNVIEDGGDSST